MGPPASWLRPGRSSPENESVAARLAIDPPLETPDTATPLRLAAAGGERAVLRAYVMALVDSPSSARLGRSRWAPTWARLRQAADRANETIYWIRPRRARGGSTLRTRADPPSTPARGSDPQCTAREVTRHPELGPRPVLSARTLCARPAPGRRPRLQRSFAHPWRTFLAAASSPPRRRRRWRARLAAGLRTARVGRLAAAGDAAYFPLQHAECAGGRVSDLLIKIAGGMPPVDAAACGRLRAGAAGGRAVGVDPGCPFVSHAFLSALEGGGLRQRGEPAGRRPTSSSRTGRGHSSPPHRPISRATARASNVFDHSWAEGLHARGRALLSQGSGQHPLHARDRGRGSSCGRGPRADEARATLVAGLQALRAKVGASSIHLTFLPKPDWGAPSARRASCSASRPAVSTG